MSLLNLLWLRCRCCCLLLLYCCCYYRTHTHTVNFDSLFFVTVYHFSFKWMERKQTRIVYCSSHFGATALSLKQLIICDLITTNWNRICHTHISTKYGFFFQRNQQNKQKKKHILSFMQNKITQIIFRNIAPKRECPLASNSRKTCKFIWNDWTLQTSYARTEKWYRTFYYQRHYQLINIYSIILQLKRQREKKPLRTHKRVSNKNPIWLREKKKPN